jgi:hypothetical protein
MLRQNPSRDVKRYNLNLAERKLNSFVHQNAGKNARSNVVYVKIWIHSDLMTIHQGHAVHMLR